MTCSIDFFFLYYFFFLFSLFFLAPTYDSIQSDQGSLSTQPVAKTAVFDFPSQTLIKCWPGWDDEQAVKR